METTASVFAGLRFVDGVKHFSVNTRVSILYWEPVDGGNEIF